MQEEYSHTYYLHAGDTDAQGRMPMWLIVARCIAVATEHANSLGIGYAALAQHGIAWVLSRLSISMDSYPRINEEYTFTTWIESCNRVFSDRCFMITGADGRVLGYARSVWVAIDIQKRTTADLSVLDIESFPIGERECPVPKQKKLAPLQGEIREEEYTFRYVDIDFNRHVNTVQYVRLILNQWPMEMYDHHALRGFEISFNHECYYDERVKVRTEEGVNPAICEISRDGQRAVAALLTFTTY